MFTIPDHRQVPDYFAEDLLPASRWRGGERLMQDPDTGDMYLSTGSGLYALTDDEADAWRLGE